MKIVALVLLTLVSANLAAENAQTRKRVKPSQSINKDLFEPCSSSTTIDEKTEKISMLTGISTPIFKGIKSYYLTIFLYL